MRLVVKRNGKSHRFSKGEFVENLQLQKTKDGVQFYVKVNAGAKKTKLTGRYGDAVKISVQSPPVDGKANKELVAFLSKFLDVPKSSVRILRGETSNFKLISVSGITFAETAEKFAHDA